MLGHLICNTTAAEEAAEAGAASLESQDGTAAADAAQFCLSAGNWVAVGIAAVLLVSVAIFLLIKVFARFCRCLGRRYSIVGEMGAVSADVTSGTVAMIYVAHAMQAFGDRMWAFAVPVMLIDLYPESLMPCALYSLGLNFSLIFLTSPVSAWIDRTDRLRVFTTAVWSQSVLILANCGLVLWLLRVKSDFSACQAAQAELPANDPAAADGGECASVSTTVALLLLAMVVTGVTAELGSTLATTSIEKDWIVVMAGGNRQLLTQFNTMLRRIDLVCKLLAPTAFGIAVSVATDGSYGRIVVVGVTIVAAWNGLCAIPQWLMGRRVYYSSAQLRQAKPVDDDDDDDEENPSSSDLVANPDAGDRSEGAVSLTAPPRTKKQSLCMKLSRFYRHHAFWPVLGYCFHYFSVLNSGVLMVGYLQSQGLNVAVIGAASGLGAFFGLVGTWLFPLLLDSPCFAGSLSRTGSFSTWMFFLTILPAAVAFYLPLDAATQGYVIIVAISVARVWLWSFDLAHTQVLQECTEPENIGFVNGVQTSLYQLFYVVQNAAALQWDNPADFYVLGTLSAGTVFMGAIFWSCWASRVGLQVSINPGGGEASDDEELKVSERMFDRAAQLDEKDLQTLAVLQNFRNQLMNEDIDDDNAGNGVAVVDGDERQRDISGSDTGSDSDSGTDSGSESDTGFDSDGATHNIDGDGLDQDGTSEVPSPSPSLERKDGSGASATASPSRSPPPAGAAQAF